MPRLLFGLCLACALTPVWAQSTDIARFNGSMHALEQLCGGGGRPEKLKHKRDRTLQHGMSAAHYEEEFNRGFRQSQADFSRLSDADKRRTCERLRELSGGRGQRF